MPIKYDTVNCRKLWCWSAQRISFIPHLFPEILQRVCKLDILGTLDMSDHCPSKLIVSTCRKFWYLSAWKNQLYTSLLSWKFAKIIQISHFGYTGHNAWLWPLKMKVLASRKLWCLFSCKKSNLFLTSFLKFCKDNANLFSSLTSFLKFCKDNANLLFQELWTYLVVHTIYIIVWTCRKLWCNIYMQKISLIHHFFLEEVHFKECCNLIGCEHFGI